MELDSLLGSIGGSKQIQTGRDPKYSYSQLRQPCWWDFDEEASEWFDRTIRVPPRSAQTSP